MAEYAILIVMAASQEYVNTYSTHRGVGLPSIQNKIKGGFRIDPA